MTKISSRPQPKDTAFDEAKERLVEILAKHTNGLVTTNPGPFHPPTFKDAAQSIDVAFTLMMSAISRLKAENTMLDIEHEILSEKYNNLIRAFQKFTFVSYDLALDEAVSEMFIMAESSGIAETTPNNELIFSSNQIISRAELKPIVAIVIEAWIDQRIKEMPFLQ